MSDPTTAALAAQQREILCEYAASSHPPICQVDRVEELMLPMRDGVRLHTICYLPAVKAPYPTIVQRSCYPATEPLARTHARAYCERGYAFILQYCRGTQESEGEWVPNVHERDDGLDTMAYLEARADIGPSGYLGSSYLALTGGAMADALPEKVRTLYLTQYGVDRFTSAYQAGLFRHDILTAWTMENAGYPIDADYLASCAYRPHVQVDEALWGGKIDWYRSYVTNTSRSDPYWQQGFWKQLAEIPAKVSLPVYIGEGWYDHHLGSALVTYETLSETAKAHTTLRIGCWNHSFQPCMQGRSARHLQNSDIRTALDWFDQILKQGVTPAGKVETYLIGADCWKTQPAFPFPEEESRAFYLDGRAADPAQIAGTACRLEPEPASRGGEISYLYDPAHPVISHGAESLFHSMTEVGSLLQPACGYREDVISFVSQPLPQALEITGKITADLFVRSDAEDTAFTVKVMEIFPDGRAYNIRSGITTLAYRGGSDRRLAYTPGQSVRVKAPLWDIAWLVGKGSRIRVDISSSDFPQYAVHSNYAGVWSEQTQTKVARQTLLWGGDTPSRILFPVKRQIKEEEK